MGLSSPHCGHMAKLCPSLRQSKPRAAPGYGGSLFMLSPEPIAAPGLRRSRVHFHPRSNASERAASHSPCLPRPLPSAQLAFLKENKDVCRKNPLNDITISSLVLPQTVSCRWSHAQAAEAASARQHSEGFAKGSSREKRGKLAATLRKTSSASPLLLPALEGKESTGDNQEQKHHGALGNDLSAVRGGTPGAA